MVRVLDGNDETYGDIMGARWLITVIIRGLYYPLVVTNSLLLNMAIEIVDDLPIKNCDLP
jgi:hypothetical protein